METETNTRRWSGLSIWLTDDKNDNGDGDGDGFVVCLSVPDS